MRIMNFFELKGRIVNAKSKHKLWFLDGTIIDESQLNFSGVLPQFRLRDFCNGLETLLIRGYSQG